MFQSWEGKEFIAKSIPASAPLEEIQHYCTPRSLPNIYLQGQTHNSAFHFDGAKIGEKLLSSLFSLHLFAWES